MNRLAIILTATTLAFASLVAAQAPSSSSGPSLLDPASLHDTAPDTFAALFDTSAGIFIVRVHRDWAPHGADRFYNLVKYHFYDGCRFFRVVPDFAAQFGIHGDPRVSTAWSSARLPEDRARVSNIRGRVTFAQGRLADTRTTQVFINYGDNSKLDIDNFAPFGEVITSMVLVERIYNGYGEGPEQADIQAQGNAFLAQFYPRLSYIKTAKIDQ